MMQSSGALRSN